MFERCYVWACAVLTCPCASMSLVCPLDSGSEGGGYCLSELPMVVVGQEFLTDQLLAVNLKGDKKVICARWIVKTLFKFRNLVMMR